MDPGSEGWASKRGETMTEEQILIEGWTCQVRDRPTK